MQPVALSMQMQSIAEMSDWLLKSVFSHFLAQQHFVPTIVV